MTLIRFFVQPVRISESTVEFDANDSHHLAVVLKKKPGDAVLVCDGTGSEYEVQLNQVSKSAAIGRITDMYRLATELPVRVTVAQALPKTLDKLEWVLQHGTELGAAEFIPFYSARSREDWQRLSPKLQRWQEIVKTAAEQSRRAYCPVVDTIRSFDQVIDLAGNYDLALFSYENEKERSLKSAMELTPARTILVVIGPEGGFTAGEYEKSCEKAFVSVSLGPRILRTETAALCLLSQIIYATEQI